MSRGTRPTRPLPSLAASLTLVVPGGSAPWGRGRRRPTQSGQEAPEAPGAATLFALPNSVAKENKPGNLTARAVRSDQGLCVWWRLPALGYPGVCSQPPRSRVVTFFPQGALEAPLPVSRSWRLVRVPPLSPPESAANGGSRAGWAVLFVGGSRWRQNLGKARELRCPGQKPAVWPTRQLLCHLGGRWMRPGRQLSVPEAQHSWNLLTAAGPIAWERSPCPLQKGPELVSRWTTR